MATAPSAPPPAARQPDLLGALRWALALALLVSAALPFALVQLSSYPHNFVQAATTRGRHKALLPMIEAIGNAGALTDASFDIVVRPSARPNNSGDEPRTVARNAAAAIVKVGDGQPRKPWKDGGGEDEARLPLGIAIPTAPQLVHRRSAVRESWMRDAEALGVPVFFFVATPAVWRDEDVDAAVSAQPVDAPSPGLRRVLAAEMQAHGDVVLCEDRVEEMDSSSDNLTTTGASSSYRGLSALTLCALQYFAFDHQREPQAILKTDDDAYVNVRALLGDLRPWRNWSAPWIMGDLESRAKVVRWQPRHPWNNDAFALATALERYPAYFQGAGYAMAFDVAASVTLANHQSKLLHPEGGRRRGGGDLVRYSVEDVSFAIWTMPTRAFRCIDEGVHTNSQKNAQHVLWFLRAPLTDDIFFRAPPQDPSPSGDAVLSAPSERALKPALGVRWLYIKTLARALCVEALRALALFRLTVLSNADSARRMMERAMAAQRWRQMSLASFCSDTNFHVLHHIDVADVARRRAACASLLAYDGGMEARWRASVRRWLLGEALATTTASWDAEAMACIGADGRVRRAPTGVEEAPPP